MGGERKISRREFLWDWDTLIFGIVAVESVFITGLAISDARKNSFQKLIWEKFAEPFIPKSESTQKTEDRR